MSLLGANGSGAHLSISAPAASGIGPNAYTAAALFMPNAFTASQIWMGYESANFSYRGMYFENGGLWVPQQAVISTPNFANPPIWYWLVVTSAVASLPARVHVAAYDGVSTMSWSHSDASGSQTVRNAINRICLGDEFGTEFKGNIACISAFTKQMTDAEVEATFVRGSALIMAATPQFFVHWPQAAGVGSPFTDLAGGGVETVRSGTWNVSTDPPNYDFSLVTPRSGRPKVWNGTSWSSHQAKVWTGTSWDPHPFKSYDGSTWVTSK